jgi:hypothetical protein
VPFLKKIGLHFAKWLGYNKLMTNLIQKPKRGGLNMDYKLIVTIVSKGRSGKVVDASHRGGASGGTVVSGHGTAVRLLPGISVEPEKEIVLTLVEAGKAQSVLEAITNEAGLNEPNQGIAFVLPLDSVTGINKNV